MPLTTERSHTVRDSRERVPSPPRTLRSERFCCFPSARPVKSPSILRRRIEPRRLVRLSLSALMKHTKGSQMKFKKRHWLLVLALVLPFTFAGAHAGQRARGQSAADQSARARIAEDFADAI